LPESKPYKNKSKTILSNQIVLLLKVVLVFSYHMNQRRQDYCFKASLTHS